MKNLLLALFAAAAIAASVLAWRQYTELVELRGATLAGDDRAALQARITELQKQNQDLQAALDQAAATPIPATADPEAAYTAAPQNNREEPGERGGRGDRRAAFREVMANPEVQGLISSAERAGIEMRYAALFRALNLTPDQSERLKALLVDRQNSRRDVVAALEQQGLSPRSDPEAFRKMVADAEAAVETNIRSVLGETGYQQLTQFERTQPQRNIVSTLQQHLSSTDAPLTYAQSEQLVQILAAAAPANEGRGGSWSRFMTTPGLSTFNGVVGPGSARITAEAVTQASTVLNPTQLKALKLFQQQQRNARQLQQLLRGGTPKG